MLKDFLLDSWSLRTLNANLRYCSSFSGSQPSKQFSDSHLLFGRSHMNQKVAKIFRWLQHGI